MYGLADIVYSINDCTNLTFIESRMLWHHFQEGFQFFIPFRQFLKNCFKLKSRSKYRMDSQLNKGVGTEYRLYFTCLISPTFKQYIVLTSSWFWNSALLVTSPNETLVMNFDAYTVESIEQIFTLLQCCISLMTNEATRPPKEWATKFSFSPCLA